MGRHQDRRAGQAARGAFTLVEILVVVVLVMLLATIAIVQVQRARMATNEQLALTNLRLLAKSAQFFYLSNQTVYPTDLTALGQPTSNPPYVADASLLVVSPLKQGYQFTYSRLTPTTFTLLADPIAYGSTGNRHYLTDQTMDVYYTDSDRNANTADPTLP
ncbi:MAG: hypothetical protein HY352_03645 [Candidatus Omnitrophica bacterium]|nr:hypothetical protein [Candidatus Omnitrophota bacterium]